MLEQQRDLGVAPPWLRLAVRSKVVALLLLYNSMFTVVAIVYGSYYQGWIQDFWKGGSYGLALLILFHLS